MLVGIAKGVSGSSTARYVNSPREIAAKINAIESGMRALDDAGLQAQTQAFRDRLGAGETLADIPPEAFAPVREAAVRTLGMRNFDVQMIGGVVLHRGEIDRKSVV